MSTAKGNFFRLAHVAAAVSAAATLMSACMPGRTEQTAPSTATSNVALKYGSQYRLPAEFAQLEPAYQKRLEETAISNIKSGMAPPSPTVSFIRFIRPDEANKVMADCLATKGVRVSLRSDGGVHFEEYPADQTPTVLAADFACQVEYPIDPKYTAPLSQQQIAAVYDYYIQELIPCLSAEGYRADAGDVPTLATFTATFGTKTAWSPYQIVERRRVELEAANGGVLPAEWVSEWQRVNRACPQSSPIDRLYPSGHP